MNDNVNTVTAAVEAGDGGKDYARVVLGGVTVTVYESLAEKGKVIVEVDYADDAAVKIYANDAPLLEQDASEPEPRHADYPHKPGALYGCPVCEKNCFCLELNKGQCGPGEGTSCVHCALVMNPDEPDTCDMSGACPQDAHYMTHVWTSGNHHFMSTGHPDEERCMTCGAVYRTVRKIALPSVPDSMVEPWFVWEYQGGDGSAVQQCSYETGRAHGYERVCDDMDCERGRDGAGCSHIDHGCNGVCCY